MLKRLQQFETAPRSVPLAALLGLFVLIHAAYYAAGVRFDTSLMAWQWQFLDVDLLRHHLLQSLWYQHSQPPLFNLFLGLALKIAPHNYPLLMQAAFLLCGAALMLCLFRLMRRLGVSRLPALLVCVFFVSSPAFILYEHYLYYTFPLAAVMALAAVTLDAYRETRQIRLAALFFALIFIQCALWSLFHLIYFVAVAGVLVARGGKERGRLLAAAALPFLLLFGLYAKNYVLFGEFSVSSWLGMNLARASVLWLPQETRGEMVADGRLSAASRTEPFMAVENYFDRVPVPAKFALIPALAQPVKSTGEINFNHYSYIVINNDYLHDDKVVIRASPKNYLAHGVLPAWAIYFTPASNYDALNKNRDKMKPALALYDNLFCGAFPYLDLPAYTPYLFLLLGLPAIFLYGTTAALSPRAKFPALSAAQKRLLLYLCLNILYVAVIGNSLERGENNRFRFVTDSFSLAILALALRYGWNAWRSKPSEVKKEKMECTGPANGPA